MPYIFSKYLKGSNRSLLLLVLSMFFFSGCAGIARTDSAGNEKHPDMRSAKLASKPIGRIEYDSFKSLKISAESPYLESESLKGRYEIVSIQGKKGQQFLITTTGICDCLGFRKWSVVPFSYLLDGDGGIVLAGKSTTPMAQTLAGAFPEDGDYYLMIVADSTSAGKRIGVISGGLAVPGRPYVPDIITLPMTSHPTGLVQVHYHKSE